MHEWGVSLEKLYEDQISPRVTEGGEKMRAEQMYSRGSKMLHICLSRGAPGSGVAFSEREEI